MADMITKEAAAAQAEEQTKAAVVAAMARFTEITDACAKAGLPTMAASLIREGATAEQVDARIKAESTRVEEIRSRVKAAKNSYKDLDAAALEAEYIAGGTSPEAVGDRLLTILMNVQAATAIRSTHSSYSDAAKGGELPVKVPNAKEIYAKRKVARENMDTLQ